MFLAGALLMVIAVALLYPLVVGQLTNLTSDHGSDCVKQRRAFLLGILAIFCWSVGMACLDSKTGRLFGDSVERLNCQPSD
jgi:hypothetical protein